jgi:hypothetical protein
MLSHGNPHAPYPGHLGPVHPQALDGRSASRSQAQNGRCIRITGEVLIPLVLLRVKQDDVLLRARIECCKMIGFPAITRGTCQAEIRVFGAADAERGMICSNSNVATDRLSAVLQ